jgi:AcrR family transcriptional regulator
VTEPTALRADARRNREAIVQAARRAFATRGLQVSLDEIARSAGVGSGTLYRHFPTRDDLVAAVFEDRVREHVGSVEEALEQDDPAQAFADYVHRICRAQAEDHGLAAIFAVGQGGEEIAALRNRAYEGFRALIDAAKASGGLREDLTAEDVAVLLIANAGIIERAGPVAHTASERFVALSLDGFRAASATPAPPPPSPRSLVEALRRAR